MIWDSFGRKCTKSAIFVDYDCVIPHMKALICVIYSQKLKGVAAVLLCAIALTKIGILYEKVAYVLLPPWLGSLWVTGSWVLS